MVSNKKIKPFPGNPRKITPERLRTLGESLNEYGSLDGFVVNVGPGKYENCIISGNQKNKHINLSKAKIDITERYETPTETGTVAIGHVTHNGELFPYREVIWDDRKCEIGNIRANNLGGRNDVDLLNQFEADILEAGGIDMDFEMFIDTFMVGDGDGGIPNNTLNSEAKEDDFEPPAEIEEIQTDIVLGDLFEIGPHRLLCGDSTKAEDVERLMGGEKADMVLSDPPYGMFLDADYSSLNWGDRKGKKYDNVIGDNDDFNPALITTFFENFDYCKEMFLWGADYYFDLLPDFKQGNYIVWDKTLQSNGDAGSNSEFELCWSRQRHKRVVLHFNWFRYFGLHSQDVKKRIHPTQKPVQVNTHFIESYSKDGNIVIDLYLGSGTTMVASDQLNRRCYAMEISPQYCQVTINRMLKLRPDIEIKKNGQPYEPNTPT